jgi:hypothetical protein
MMIHRLFVVLVGALVITACSSAATDPTTASSALESSGDGTPTRVPCTNNFGTGLTGSFGRLDGIVVAVVPPGHGSCNADAHHVHVQVLSGGETYDIAVNTDAGFSATKDMPLPGGAWADGWHAGGSLDYVTDLGLHVGDFQAGSEAALSQQLETALANANHISVFATIYSHGGAHLVHRHGQGHDGLLVTDPLSASPHLFAFHFSNQSF